MATIFSTAPLLGSTSYTGPTQTVDINQGRITGTVFADSSGTIFIEQSDDGTNFDTSTSYAVSASDGKGFSEDIVSNFWRIRYVNGSTAQTAFRLFAKPRL